MFQKKCVFKFLIPSSISSRLEQKPTSTSTAVDPETGSTSNPDTKGSEDEDNDEDGDGDDKTSKSNSGKGDDSLITPAIRKLLNGTEPLKTTLKTYDSNGNEMTPEEYEKLKIQVANSIYKPEDGKKEESSKKDKGDKKKEKKDEEDEDEDS